MNSSPNASSPAPGGEPTPEADHPTPEHTSAPAAGAGRRPLSRMLVLIIGVIALAALLLGGLLWGKLALLQDQLARQSADSGTNSLEARALARLAQEQARETAARQAAMDVRLSEVALQRSQLEELMQSLSRSRDENLVVDIESAIRLALQQAQLTGSVEPLLAALKSAEQRLVRAAQPRLAALQRALARDLARVKGSTLYDVPALLVRLDEALRQADELPLANAVATPASSGSLRPSHDEGVVSWWQRSQKVLLDEMRGLVRVRRIEQPEAVLLSPEQSFFLRENFKLLLLNVRVGLLSRQFDVSRADLAAAGSALNRYFDLSSRKTQRVAAVLQQLQGQMKALELPRIDETLAALATASGGR